MRCGIARRHIYKEGDVELLSERTLVVCLHICATHMQPEVVHLLGMVGEVQNNGIALGKHIDDAVYHIVVVVGSVKIMGHLLALLVVEWQLALYVGRLKLGIGCGIAFGKLDMLAIEMEDDEVAVGRIHLRLVLLIGIDELHVVIVGLLVAVVEDMTHDVGGIEESHRGIKLLVHLGSGKLVAVENHIVTALAQQQRKQGGVAQASLESTDVGERNCLKFCVVPLSEAITSLNTYRLPSAWRAFRRGLVL